MTQKIIISSGHLHQFPTSPGSPPLYVRDEGKTEDEENKSILPDLEKGDLLKLLQLLQEQRFTQPPSRYTEASLIRYLEERGIGRPSTYASIISSIQYREYVTKTGGILKPTELGFTVIDLLIKHFQDIVDIEFTARMEEELDEIAEQKKEWVSVVRDFYTPFDKLMQNANEVIERVKMPDEITSEVCDKCGNPWQSRWGGLVNSLPVPATRNVKQPVHIKLKPGSSARNAAET